MERRVIATVGSLRTETGERIRKHYERKMEAAGVKLETVGPGEPIGRIDGLLIPGGTDIKPEYYGQTPHDKTKAEDPERDELEIGAAQYALENDIPILGICRGIQVLAVATGGTLIQDIPTQTESSIIHLSRRNPKSYRAMQLNRHKARLKPGSKIYEIYEKQGEIEVNSGHHQALDNPGELVPVAWAEDGIIEAAEHPSRRFVIGVQYHPEGMRDGEIVSVNLFAAFVRAVKGEEVFNASTIVEAAN